MKTTPDILSGRFHFLDLLRGIFILVMVEGHTLRALLDPAIQAGAVYHTQDLIHNLTGPAFLFAAGIAFCLSFHRHWESRRRWDSRLRGRLRRWLAVLVMGYALQLTFFSLRRTMRETTPEQLANLLSMNILQCIIVSLLLLQVLLLVVPGRTAFFRSALTLAVGIALATPFLWRAAPHLPLWVGTLVGSHWGSIFPLFPYGGFAFAGAAWGHLFFMARERGQEPRFLRHSLRFSAVAGAGSILIALAPLPEIYSDFWYTSPLFFFLRVAILAAVAAGLRQVEPRVLSRGRLLVVAGQESLLIYVVHLPILFGSAWNPDTGLVKLLGTALPVAEAVLVWVLLTAVLVLLACWWSWWKQSSGWRAAAAKWWLAGYFTYAFLTA